MGSRPNTDDMQRWSLELGLYLRKELNRFKLANKLDKFEEVLMDSLPSEPALNNNQENSIRLERLGSREDQRRLTGFLERLVDRCESDEDHSLMQRVLRESLLKSRRSSVLQSSHHPDSRGPAEPICFFCAADLPADTTTTAALGASSNHSSHPHPTSCLLENLEHQNHTTQAEPQVVDSRISGAHMNPIYQLKFIESQAPPTPPASNCAPTPDVGQYVEGVTAEPSTTPPQSPVQLEPVNLSGGLPIRRQVAASPEDFAPRPAASATAGIHPRIAFLLSQAPPQPASGASNASAAALPARSSSSPDPSERSLHIVEGPSTANQQPQPESSQPETNSVNQHQDHEDSMQHWFEDLNSKAPGELPRASTPLKEDGPASGKRKKLCLGGGARPLPEATLDSSCWLAATQHQSTLTQKLVLSRCSAATPSASQQPTAAGSQSTTTNHPAAAAAGKPAGHSWSSQRPATARPRTKRTNKRPSAGHSSSKQLSKQQQC